MSFDPSTLDLFLRVANLGAIGKAGQEQGLSPTAATQRIQALERELGVQLLTRTTRSVSLTADGETFLQYAKQILTSIDDARSALSGGPANIKGELRVTGSASFGRRYIAPFVSEFLRLYPNVTVRLELTDAMFDIVEQGFDVAIRIGALPSSSLVARKLADNPRLLVASPAYIEEDGCPQTPKDLEQHNCIILGDARVWRLSRADGEEEEARVGGNFVTNFGESATQAALTDNGIALKSLWDVRHCLERGDLVPVLTDYEIKPPWAIWAVRPAGPHVPVRVRLFVDYIADKLKGIADRDRSVSS